MTPSGQDHVDVGAYVLNVLDPAERAAFEVHLAGCPECARQVGELSFMERLLAEYVAAADPAAGYAAPAAPGPQDSGSSRQGSGGSGGSPQNSEHEESPASLERLVAEVSTRRRRGRTRRLVLALAASVLVIGGPAVTAVLVSADPAPPATVAAPQFAATDPDTGAQARVGVESKGWGSQVSLELSRLQGPLTCSLIAVGRTGERQTVTSWSVPAVGYGTSDMPAPLRTVGGVGFRPADIDHFEVRTLDGGKLLVSVPAAPA
ncbi:zf-HC2 domain-containing protein [Kitasatospora sp. NPDC004240]